MPARLPFMIKKQLTLVLCEGLYYLGKENLLCEKSSI